MRQFTWVDSRPGEIPVGALVAGETEDGRVLYTAQARGEAGHYDVTKNCAEYSQNTYTCDSSWKILVVTQSKWFILSLSTSPSCTFSGLSNINWTLQFACRTIWVKIICILSHMLFIWSLIKDSNSTHMCISNPYRFLTREFEGQYLSKSAWNTR